MPCFSRRERTGWFASENQHLLVSVLGNHRPSYLSENRWHGGRVGCVAGHPVCVCRFSPQRPVQESHVRRWVLRCKASTWDVVPIYWSRVADWTPLSRAAQLLDPSGVLRALTLASVGAPRSCSEQNRWWGSSPGSTRLLWDSFVLQNKRVSWCKRKCQS